MSEKSFVIEVDVNYSEYVVRSAASWAFSDVENFPDISINSDSWLLLFNNSISMEQKAKFRCYLNDYRLRELVDITTDQERRKIIERAFRSAYLENLAN